MHLGWQAPELDKADSRVLVKGIRTGIGGQAFIIEGIVRLAGHDGGRALIELDLCRPIDQLLG